jgi:hypothetical protein
VGGTDGDKGSFRKEACSDLLADSSEASSDDESVPSDLHSLLRVVVEGQGAPAELI